MEIRQLRYFLAVAETLHFARAAERLHIAQPSLSQQIRALEEELGVRLFERSKRYVALTTDGEALLPYARRLVTLADDAQEEFAERSGLRRGRVRLGTTPTLGGHLLPKAIGGFFHAFPGLELTITEDGSDRLARQLDQGHLDLALLVQDANMVESIAFEPLLEEEILLALPVGHPLAGREVIPWRDLREERFILCREGYHLRSMTFAACEEAGFKPKVAISGTDIDTALRFVRAGLGITLVPRMAVDAPDGFVVASLVEPTLRRTVGIASNPHRYLSQAASAMRDYLREALK